MNEISNLYDILHEFNTMKMMVFLMDHKIEKDYILNRTRCTNNTISSHTEECMKRCFMIVEYKNLIFFDAWNYRFDSLKPKTIS